MILSMCIILASCSKTYYQVYTVSTSNLEHKEKTLVYENSDCLINYNLWAERGNPGFTIQNKTDKDIFIILPQSFFIKNGIAYDYYKNREFKDSRSLNVSTESMYGMFWKYGTTATAKSSEKTLSSTVSYHEMPVICIPPHSFKIISEYSIIGKYIRSCNDYQENPKKASTPIQFTKEESPICFKNRITYSFDKDGCKTNYIENEFWISEIINYSKKTAGKEMTIKECDGDSDNNANKVFVFSISAPNKFYNSYVGKSGSGKNSDKSGLVIGDKDEMYK